RLIPTARQDPDTGGERVMHYAGCLMLLAQQMAHFVRDGREQVHPVLLALVAGRGKLGIVARRRIDKPAPVGGVVVEPDGVVGCEAKSRAAKIGDADIESAQIRDVDTGTLPPGERFEE